MMCLWLVLNWNKRLSILLIFFGLIAHTFAQSSAHSTQSIPSLPVNFFTMPSIPSVDSLERCEGEAFTFAYPFSVSISKDSLTYVVDGDSLRYRVIISSKSAYSLNLIFENVSFVKGATLSAYGIDSVDFQQYTARNKVLDGVLPTSLISGDVVFVDFVEPSCNQEKSSWTITQVAHAYKDVDNSNSLLKSESASCHIDVNCADGNDWQNEKRAVCRILIQGTTLCTGTLVNNTAQDNTPYVLTANHCISTKKKALSSVFYFDYENETCGDASSAKKKKSISGSTLVATSPDGKVDFSLVEMSSIPPKSYNPYYAGWNTESVSTSGVACIHHPKGDVKKISTYSGKPTTATFKTNTATYAKDAHWKVAEWTTGTTEGGSSGSALFNANHQIIGDLSGGEASCEKPVNDFFSKFSKAWNYYEASSASLQSWLDPLNLGVSSCDGRDPYSLAANQLTNLGFTDSIGMYDFAPKASGFWSGITEVGWNTVAERFVTTKSLYAMTFCGIIDTATNLENVVFCVWSGVKIPETELCAISFEKSMMKDSVTIQVALPTPIASSTGIIWVGYRVEDNSSAFVGYLSETENNTFYVKHKKGWVSTDSLGFSAHLATMLHVTNEPDTLTIISFEKPFFATMIDTIVTHKVTEELFGIDSLGAYPNQMYKIQLGNVSQMAGPNELRSDCFANYVSISEPVWLRGLKLAVASIPDTNVHTDVVLWQLDKITEIARKTVENNVLRGENYSNQIHFDSLIYVDSDFLYGICLDTTNYEKGLSLLQMYDIDNEIDGYFHYDGFWSSFSLYNLMYNVGVQPVIAKSRFHFNADSAVVLQYPLRSVEEYSVGFDNSVIVYPTVAKDMLYIRFLKNIFEDIEVSIIDNQGKCIERMSLERKAGIYEVPMQRISEGTFTLVIDVGGEKITKKFVHLVSD